MTSHTMFSVQKRILRFFQRGKTQRGITDLTVTSKSSVNRTIVSFEKTGSTGPKPRTGKKWHNSSQRLATSLIRPECH